MALLKVHGWHTECGECRYGSGGWASSPAREGKPILTPRSRTCPGCGVEFTEVSRFDGPPEPFEAVGD